MNLQTQLERILSDLAYVKVESTIMIGAILLLISGLIAKKAIIHKLVFILTVIVALVLSIHSSKTGLIMSDSLFLSTQSLSFTSLFLVSLGLILIFSRDNRHSTEFYFFMLSLGAGSIFMMKVNSFLVLYLSIELVSFVSYLLTSFSFKRVGHEAAIKYLLFGGISSALMLLGLAIIYGSTGTFYISSWSMYTFDSLLGQVGLLLMLFGIFFKASLVPFHSWVPATYQSAPNDAVAMLSVIPKISAIILLQRVLQESELSSQHWIMQAVLMLGIVTIVVGTLGALRQVHTRRMISFGAIAQSGFLLPFAMLTGASSQESLWFYSVIYILMNLGAFYLLDLYESNGIERNEDYSKTKGQVLSGVVFTIILVSLVGLPPLAGFTAKFFLFSTLYEGYELTSQLAYFLYLIVALLATVVSLFFYFRIPYRIFLTVNEKGVEFDELKFGFISKFIATIFAVTLLLLFFVPKLVVMMQQLLIQHHE